MKNWPVIFTSVILISCGANDNKDQTDDPVARENHRYDLALEGKLAQNFSPLPVDADNPNNKITTGKVALGHALYYDTRLSKDGNISCNSCHNLMQFGVDNLSTSPGDAGEHGDRNSPTVLNAAYHLSQFWDGRAADLEEQAGMPVLNPVEMAIPSESFLINRLKQVPEYTQMFEKAFPDDADPINYENLRKAIGAFERKLVTPSRFDEYLKGDKTALSVKEKKGLLTFINTGCIQCHNGALLGGNSMQKFGVYDDYWKYTNSEKIDKGRFAVTNDSLDLYMFKVPALRNIAKTSPYFHDGSVKDLNRAVSIMAKVQLNKDLSDSELENLVAFLESLTGEVPAFAKSVPNMLKNTKKDSE